MAALKPGTSHKRRVPSRRRLASQHETSQDLARILDLLLQDALWSEGDLSAKNPTQTWPGDQPVGAGNAGEGGRHTQGLGPDATSLPRRPGMTRDLPGQHPGTSELISRRDKEASTSIGSVETEASEDGEAITHEEAQSRPERNSKDKDNRRGKEEEKKRSPFKRMKDRLRRTFRWGRKGKDKRGNRDGGDVTNRGSGDVTSESHLTDGSSAHSGKKSSFHSLPRSFGRRDTNSGPPASIREYEIGQRPDTVHKNGITTGSDVRRTSRDDAALSRQQRRFSEGLPFMDEDGVDHVDGRSSVSQSRKPSASSRIMRECSLEVDGSGDESSSKDEIIGEIVDCLEMLGDDIDHGGRRMDDAYVERQAGDTLQRMGDRMHSEGHEPLRRFPEEEVALLAEELSPLEQELVQVLREKGDSLPDRVCDWFSRTVRQYVGDDHNWHQLRFVYHFTRQTVKTIASTPALAASVQAVARQILHDELAPWVARQGGVEGLLLE